MSRGAYGITGRKIIAIFVLMAMLAGLTAWVRPDRALNVATARVAHILCANVFVSGMTPDRAFAENVAPASGTHILLSQLHYRVDIPGKKVTAQWHGRFTGEATYHPGYGCALRRTAPDAATLQAAREVAAANAASGSADENVGTTDPAMAAALKRAFAEPVGRPRRNVHAIVVMHEGRIVAERYAAGFNPDTPQIGYSLSKAVVNALFGILVREGKLDMHAPAPVPAWKSAGDPRHPISLDQLSRMTSGLNFSENDSGFDRVSTMLFAKRDMARYAAKASLRIAPGTSWEYSSGNTMILAGVLRDTVGGSAPGLIRFAHRELFAPLGMRHVLMEFDGAQSVVGSTRIYASARDWARLGQLYLDDGMVGNRRILPAGWSDYVSRPTLDSFYGAGFWTNTGTDAEGNHPIPGMPEDAYFASGINGQRIVIVPSRRLVVVRMGATIDPPNYDMPGLVRLVNDVAAALPAQKMATPVAPDTPVQ